MIWNSNFYIVCFNKVISFLIYSYFLIISKPNIKKIQIMGFHQKESVLNFEWIMFQRVFLKRLINILSLIQIHIEIQYYVDYWFTVNGTATHYADSFQSAMGVVAQVPNLIVAIINVLNLIRGPLLYRVLAPLAFNSLLIVIILALVIFQQPSDQGKYYFGLRFLLNWLNYCEYHTFWRNRSEF